MDLITTIEHKRGTAINIGDGTVYEIDNLGIIRDIEEEHAAILLENKSWKKLEKSGPTAHLAEARDPDMPPAELRKSRIAAAKAQSSVTLADGTEVPMGKTVTDEQAAAAIQKQEAEARQGKAAAEQGSQWPEPGSENYPVPSLDLDEKVLHLMCNDYKIEVMSETPKEEMVQKLNEAMGLTEPSDESSDEPAPGTVEDLLANWPEAGSDAYPDPTVDMDIEVLRRMCDDYRVEYSGRTKAKTLVKKLEEVMYEPEE